MEPVRRHSRGLARVSRGVAVTLTTIALVGCVGQRPSFIDETPTTIPAPSSEPAGDTED